MNNMDIIKNPTKRTNWQLSFKITYKDILYIEDFLDLVADSVSISNHQSDTIEINPDDIWQVDAYFEYEPNFEIIINQLNFISHNNKILITDLSYSATEEQDWVSIVQEKFKPFCVGRFFISSSSYKDQCPTDKSPIIIEASCAFGTGEHHTTKSCIEAIESLSHLTFTNILDMGTGTGILAIAASKIWPKAWLLGCDIDEMAVNIASTNAINNICNNIEFFESDGYNNLKLEGKQFDLIISNILACPLIKFAPEIANHCASKGYIILAGFLENQSNEVIQAHEQTGFTLIHTIQRETWVTIVMQKE
ncbi:MAG: ribosomal protein methyltransferase [Rickettsiaceae bacterium]|jgi:ribosomal protein L11 methyltransferase|nr:ribosomal protein methyltransferase [Rickettsiaceae bacterium]